MVPSQRLITVTFLLAPFGLVPALAPQYNAVGMLTAGLVFFVAGTDLLLSRKRLDGFQLSIPDLVRMTINKPGEIYVQCTGKESGEVRLTTAIDLPTAFLSDQSDLSFTAPDRDQVSTLKWKTVPHQRGRFQLSRIALAGHSFLGLWEIRSYHPVNSEIRVYPDLLSESGRISALFLQLSRVGTKVRRQVGQGRDFEKLRDYIRGDSLDRIHWKATAKRNKPMSKEYQVERTQEVYVLIDSSRLAGVPVKIPGQDTENLFEIYIKAALLTSLVARLQGDHFGLCTFSRGVKNFLRANSGKNHFNACREQLFTLEPERVSPDYRELVTFLGNKLHKRALLIILTNLDDPVLAEEFTACMELLNRRHLVVAISANPAFAHPLFEDDEVNEIDDLYRNLAGHLQDQQLKTLARQLRRHGVHLYRPDPARLTIQVIDQYMAIKERQQL